MEGRRRRDRLTDLSVAPWSGPRKDPPEYACRQQLSSRQTDPEPRRLDLLATACVSQEKSARTGLWSEAGSSPRAMGSSVMDGLATDRRRRP
jgi:hypothetical protein